MPGRDGTGPLGKGPGAGRGGRGAMGSGPAGVCVCPNCGEKVSHTTGMPCTSVKCHKCGTGLIRGD